MRINNNMSAVITNKQLLRGSLTVEYQEKYLQVL